MAAVSRVRGRGEVRRPLQAVEPGGRGSPAVLAALPADGAGAAGRVELRALPRRGTRQLLRRCRRVPVAEADEDRTSASGRRNKGRCCGNNRIQSVVEDRPAASRHGRAGHQHQLLHQRKKHRLRKPKLERRFVWRGRNAGDVEEESNPANGIREERSCRKLNGEAACRGFNQQHQNP